MEKVGKGDGVDMEVVRKGDGGVVNNVEATRLLGELEKYITDRNVSITEKSTQHGNTTACVIVLTDDSIIDDDNNILGNITLFYVNVDDDDEDGDVTSDGRLPNKGYMSVGWLSIKPKYGNKGWATILLLYAILFVYFICYFIKVVLDDDSDNFANPENNIYNKVGFRPANNDGGPEKVMRLSNEILRLFQSRIEDYRRRESQPPKVTKKGFKQKSINAAQELIKQQFISQQFEIINISYNKAKEVDVEPPPVKRSRTMSRTIRRSARLNVDKETVNMYRTISMEQEKANKNPQRKEGERKEGGKKNKRKTKKRKTKKRKTKKRKTKKRI